MEDLQSTSEYQLRTSIQYVASQSIKLENIIGIEQRLKDYIKTVSVEEGYLTIRLERKIIQDSKVITDYNINKIINVYISGLGDIGLKDLVYSNTEILFDSSLNTKEVEIIYLEL